MGRSKVHQQPTSKRQLQQVDRDRISSLQLQWEVAPQGPVGQALLKELKRIVDELDPGKEKSFRASIAEPQQQDGSMDAIVFYAFWNAKSQQELFEVKQEGFNWKEDSARSIAGRCAYINDPVPLFDLRNTKDPNYRYWIKPTRYSEPVDSGSIVAVPVRGERGECLAVLSITCAEYGFFDEGHISRLKSDADQIRDILLHFRGRTGHEVYNDSTSHAVRPPAGFPADTEANMVTERGSNSARQDHVKESEEVQWLDTVIENWDSYSDDIQVAIAGRIEALRRRWEQNGKPSSLIVPDQSEPANGWIDPQEIHTALDTVIEARWPHYEGKTGPKPVRVDRIRNIIRGRESEPISLTEYAKEFKGRKNPRKYAASTISWLNVAFEQLGIDLELGNITIVGVHQRYDTADDTFYVFRRPFHSELLSVHNLKHS